jgi:hypothetical protein
MVTKPVALVNVSRRSTYAQASLAETLRTMSVQLIGDTSWRVPLPQRDMASIAIAADPTLAASLRDCLAALATAVANVGPVRSLISDS